MKKFMYSLSIAFALWMVAPSYADAQTTVKKKTRTSMSSKKKGALIGAGAGAATGVAVSKNDSKGAIVGGVVGAGVGYAYGRHRDKKHPNKKKVYKTKTVVQ